MPMRGRPPPGLECRHSDGNQDSSPPSPHTPEPPVVWDSAAGPEAEYLPTGALTPPRGQSLPYSTAVRPPLDERSVTSKGRGRFLPAREGIQLVDEVRRPPGLAPVLAKPWAAAAVPEPVGWRSGQAPSLRMPGGQSSPVRMSLSGHGEQCQPGRSVSEANTRQHDELPPDNVASQHQVPPPPVPVPPVPPSQELPVTHLSLGSVGHPHSCASACRYVKRKGGCREGARCPNCHLCFWRRDRDQNAEREPPAPEVVPQMDAVAAAAAAAVASVACDGVATLISIGTRGHPHRCAAACRYVRRKSGCRNGAACPNCHACLWTRELQGGPAASVGQTTNTGLLRESTQTLEGLIRLFLNRPEPKHEVSDSQDAFPTGPFLAADLVHEGDGAVRGGCA